MISERDNPKEIEKFFGKIRGRTSIQYYCPTCKSLLPKSAYTRVRKPPYCLECGQKLDWWSKDENN